MRPQLGMTWQLNNNNKARAKQNYRDSKVFALFQLSDVISERLLKKASVVKAYVNSIYAASL